MTSDMPNAFVQTDVDKQKIRERIAMKIKRPVVDMLVEMAPEIDSGYVIEENGKKVLYVMILKALYGMLQSSLLYYNKFRKDIESIGFEVNPFDPCVANRIVNGKQHTVVWHVDDLKSSRVDPKVNEDASDNVGKVKSVRGKRHDYLAMWLDFSEEVVLQSDMRPDTTVAAAVFVSIVNPSKAMDLSEADVSTRSVTEDTNTIPGTTIQHHHQQIQTTTKALFATLPGILLRMGDFLVSNRTNSTTP
ncbi:hypothetical protein IV203_036008 [Nitzschia inconspicua]|uniref:Uncharacterized protein n=1 Tax=Nitzschia inconspicua TaxID=303405 RepID=A0A9K3LFN1_9STRA|nr:hypothetical protein IV203_036008 [Nitzschia inconspicua]